MINEFIEVIFLTDRDLTLLLQQIENRTLQIAIYNCSDCIKARVFQQFSYVGWKNYEMDRRLLEAPTSGAILLAQREILEILNYMIENHELEDFLSFELM